MKRIDDKDLHKLMNSLGFMRIVDTKHCLVFTNQVHKIRTSKTTSDKHRRLKNIKAELKRLNYNVT